MSVYLFATLDTKGREIGYVRDLLAACDVPTVVVDVGCLGEPAIAADVARYTTQEVLDHLQSLERK